MITNFIQLDFNKENDLKVPSVQYDSGSRFVKIKLQQNKVPFEINGYRVTVVANKVDGTEIMNDCTILDGANGLVEFEITEQFNAVEGVVDCQLKLFKDEILLTSMPFNISVVKSVSTKEIVSSNELKTLVNALGEVQNIDNRFAQTNAQLSNIETHLSGYVNILSFGAIRNDKSYMNDAVFSEAITYCSENKVGLFIPQGVYYISDPIFLKRDVNITGNKATIKMVSNNVAEYVMYAQDINNFKISGINLCGNRTNFSEGNTVSTDGLFLKGCSYFTIEEMNYSDCKNGFRAYMSYCGEIKRCTSIRCQKYAFNCSNSCTSLKFDTCISWGCGGGFNITSCVYMTIINPANDHNSAGGSDNDPWLPQGSGGNYLNPLPIYKIVGSQVSIISSGTENAFSPLIHMEGASVVMTNPYFWKSQCYADDFRFIKIVGTSVSSLDIINADFRDIENKRDVYYTRCGIYVDNSDKQKIRTNKYFKISDTFGVYDMYNIDAMVVYDREIMLNFNKYTANINSSIPFLSQNGAYGEVKLLDNNYVFECPKQAGEYIYKLKKGVIKLKISGTYQSPTEKLDMKVIGCNGEAETVVDSFSNDGNNVTFRKIINLSGYDDCYLKLTYVYNSSSFKINEFVCEVLN